MLSRPLAIDLTRLATRLGHTSPSGIDRVELAYARHVLRAGDRRFGIVSTGHGPRVLDRDTALGLAERVAQGWVEDAEPEADPAYRRLIGAAPAEGSAGGPTMPRRRRAGAVLHRLERETWLRAPRGRPIDALPTGTAYLHVSQLRLERPERFDWLTERPDIRAVITIHDLIPIDYPEYCRPGEAHRHAARLETVARHAARVFVDSADVGERLGRHLASRRLRAPPITAVPLGIEPQFSRGTGDPARLARPTFLACGTIEPRKNHLMLLNVWRRLSERLGPGTPRLVIVGRRGWEAESAIAMLDRCPGIRDHVVEAAGLTTPGLAALMRSATALLMPSFAEGYGLPVLEAAACGLPVVAADVPVLREIAGPFARFVDPNDALGWMTAVEDLAAPDSAPRADLAARLVGYAAPGWEGYFDRVEAVLAEL
ncbi:MAG: glycosyltransferase family 1 protein [Methylobacterium sp.]